MSPRWMVCANLRNGESPGWLRMNGRAVPALVRDRKDATAFLEAKANAWALLIGGTIWMVAP